MWRTHRSSARHPSSAGNDQDWAGNLNFVMHIEDSTIIVSDRTETTVNPSIRQSKRAQRTTGRPILVLVAAALFVSFMLASFSTPPAAAGTAREYFPQTGQTVPDPFLSYWRVNGALKIFGYPISPARYELDPSTGKTLFVQWFERARFEYHPDDAPEYQIQLGLLGRQLIETARPVAPGVRQTVKVYLVGPNWQWNENGDGLVPIEIQVV